MARWSIRRFIEALVTLSVASILIFAIVSATPGDPAAYVLRSQSGNYAPTPEKLAEKRHELGLDQPAHVQYFEWAGRFLSGDLGKSFRTGEPVHDIIFRRLGPTLRLTLVAGALALAIAVGLALISVRYIHTPVDSAIVAFSAFFASLPAFAICLAVVDFVCIRLKLAPLLADGSWRAALLPALCLGLTLGTWWAQILRTGMLSAMAQPYAETSFARGSSVWRVAWVHALPNAFIPFLSMLAIGLGHLLAGTAIVEAVFNWPGIGSLMVSAIHDRDLVLIQALVLLTTVSFVSFAFLADALSRIIDPRLQKGLR
jgi:peptide/nickel transport system permease protein